MLLFLSNGVLTFGMMGAGVEVGVVEVAVTVDVVVSAAAVVGVLDLDLVFEVLEVGDGDGGMDGRVGDGEGGFVTGTETEGPVATGVTWS